MDDFEAVHYDQRAQRLVDEMIAAEARELEKRRSEQEQCECKDGMFPEPGLTDRRKFLLATGALAGLAGLSGIAYAAEGKAPPGAHFSEVPADPTKVQGRPVGAQGGYGSRSQFETEVRWRFPTATAYSTWSMTPLEKMLGNITASGLHFVRDHNGTPNH